MPESIAIIGYGFRFPGGCDTPSKLWSLIKSPRDIASNPPPSRFDIDPFYHPVSNHHGTTNATKSYWLDDSPRINIAEFDAAFFNIQSREADAMDPQQRVLLEVIYDALCAAGQPMEQLRGSDTAIYVGMMCDDWHMMLSRDWQALPRYTATGVERGIMANRVSYFFDWHGPSMTIDTACSSSMVALDLAVQALRSGKSKVAVAAGSNLILSPAMYVSESNLGMLSTSGRCAMWDIAADGYARGEGVAAVIIKTLSQALADNDPIQCIIRETAVNQDGRKPGLTMPSSRAQAALISECYRRAGLDPANNLNDRPQYCHAHGTGTQAGDPQEAEAIAFALFPVGSRAAREAHKLLVGSVKTVIGHTEGTAGLASIISTALALKSKVIPPNLHFHTPNPSVAPFLDQLEIPTTAVAWPVATGQVRRASVNSFGFGGTNAHCILEEYISTGEQSANSTPHTLFTPLIFSAASRTALKQMVLEAHTYLRGNPGVNMRDFAYTLQHRRSTLPYRTAVAAPNTQDAIDTLANVGLEDSGVRHGTSRQPPRILGIFTGQGAQWPRMGARLIETSPFIVTRIAELDAALQSLPNPDHRPGWTIHDQIVASPESSRLTEAAVSQPLCLAVQIIIVDILRAAGISLCGVVGHSSGEIGAAYAAGFLSATDAIRIAYLRGMHANKAASPNSRVSCGAMIAVGIPAAEAKRFCKAQFAGRLEIAAENCASSVTLSGDEDAALEAIQFFHMQGVFARLLKINTAYHSCHMAPCAIPYLASLDACGIEPCQQGNTKHPVWFSTVFEGQTMTTSSVANQYWVDNMCKPVLFAGGLARAVEQIGPFDLVIEIGPHPALKGPASSLLNCAREMPYISLLRRGTDDVHALCSALGYIWAQLGPNSVQFAEVDMLLSSTTRSPVMLSDLPPYPFDHGRNYWHHSRLSDHFRPRTQIHLSNPILGFRCLEAATPGSFQWRNILQPTEIGWLSGHQLQGQIVFPAMGYVSMSVEAIQLVLADIRPNDSIRLFRLTDLEISRAIVFNTDDAAIETIFSLFLIAKTEYSVRAEWRCYSSTSSSSMTLNAKGCVSAQFGSPSAEALPFKTTESFGLVSVKDADFYSNLSHLGYNYAPPFRGVSSIRRKPKYSVSTVVDQSASRWEDNLTLHPGMLDSALQTIFAAWSYPGDTQLWSLHAPVSVASIIINPYFSALGPGGKQRYLCSETLIHWKKPTDVLADVAMRTADAEYAFLEFDGVKLIPISPAASEDDRAIFSRFKYASAVPDTQLVSTSGRLLMPRDGCPLSRDTGEFDLVGSPSKRVSACPIDDCAGRIVLAISHRYPQADICEICGETGATPSAVLKALDGRYGSYTFTDVSCDFAKSAKERFHRETRPMSFKAFDVERDPQSQGFPECSYDVIIALNIRSGLGGVGGPLSNIRRLLKPGGFLIASGGTSVKSPAVEMAAIGTMSEWSSGTRSARSGGPLLTLAQWDTVLKMTGFSGIDTASTEIKASQRADIIVSQAVDYRISWLRDPLSFEQMPPGVRIGTLAIIGGTTWPVHKLVQDILKLVAGRFRDTLAFDTIEEYAVSELARSVAGPGGVSILSLTDLDRPYLEEMTGEKFEALKACTSARTLLWVTCGSLEDRPYSYMMTGITRTIKSENPAMHVQMYDLDPNLASCIQPTTAVDLANSLLQQITLHSWGNDASLLWTAEPEVYIRDGRQLIPRLVPDHEKNDRYNSQYKSLLTTVDPSNARLELAAGDGGMLELRQLSPLQLLPGPSTECRTLRVTHSVLQAVFVGSAGFLRVCIGIDMSAGETVLALSTCETSPTRVPAPWCIPFATPPTPVALVDVAANLIATRIFSFTCWNGALMIYGSDAALQRAIQSRASDNNVHVVFTTTNACQKHMQSPLSVRGKPTVPNNTTLFVNFVEGVIPEVVECLPPACLRLDKVALVSHTAEKEVDAAEIAHVSDLLQQAVSSIPSTSLSMECIPLSEASSCDPLQKPLSVVDWNATAAVSARVQPIDTGTLFRADRTYLFVGMASELGQSLAGWMIAHGARHIVLSSRTPKLQPNFVEEMHDKYSANVTAIALDITSRTSLYSVHAMIQATLPPIAGILNGAMVLQDALFTSMTHEQFDAATMPKVQGTVLLDELFYSDTSLDFFIVASSISSVIGWSGQANYSAANQFMTALVTQRRNRGVAGSTMNIPAILGIGHAARSGTFDFAYFQSLGHVNIGEEDLHTLFAEAILSGRPCPLRASYGTTQVVMGIDYITAAANLNSPLTHRRDVKFAHFITPDTQAGRAHLANEAHPTKQLRVQLQSHIPREPTTTYTVVCNSFVKHLKRVLRLPPDHLIDESIPLNEQGVDSLVAMDIRAWFLSELEVDSPTLLIMGGGSVSDLVWMAVERVHGDDREECASGDQTGFSNKLSTPSPRSPSSLERGSEK